MREQAMAKPIVWNDHLCLLNLRLQALIHRCIEFIPAQQSGEKLMTADLSCGVPYSVPQNFQLGSKFARALLSLGWALAGPGKRQILIALGNDNHA